MFLAEAMAMTLSQRGQAMTKRGDVVIVDFPFVGGTQGKTRPAVVVQCDQLNQRIDTYRMC